MGVVGICSVTFPNAVRLTACMGELVPQEFSKEARQDTCAPSLLLHHDSSRISKIGIVMSERM